MIRKDKYLAMVTTLRSRKWLTTPVSQRVEKLIALGYQVERVRHFGSKVGDLHVLKSGEGRIAVDAPRGKYRTAWSIIVKRFGTLELLL